MASPSLADAYWRHYRLATGGREQRLAAQELEWAEAEVRRALVDTVAAIRLLVDLADAAPDDGALAYLGAGPIEDLLVDPAPTVVDHIEQAARRHPRFRYALRCAWFDEHVQPSARDRLRAFGPPP